MNLIVITNPTPVKNEALICNSLFAHGLETLHLRKPEAGREVCEQFIEHIEPRYRNRIVIHDHYDLVNLYGLRGIHLKSGMAESYVRYTNTAHISISCHSFEEIANLPFRPAYCFLSPVFDSISKQGYPGKFGMLAAEIQSCGELPPVVALGGITPKNLRYCQEHGFQGAAVLGYIWEHPDEAVQRFIRMQTPFAMSIAGFDPSSGAGITADLKTFESCGVYGLGICSAITFQNQDEYTGTRWTSPEDIFLQCDLQFRKEKPRYIKIGLIENFDVLQKLVNHLTETIPDVKIIWDPILKASAGFSFHENSGLNNQLEDILNKLYLITPNTDELRQLFGTAADTKELQQICREHRLQILWKGGHNRESLSCDRLITPEELFEFSVQRGKYDKHGTGCVLSAALTARLASGNPLPAACNKAQLYVSQFIDSNNSNLGHHTIGRQQSAITPAPADLPLQYITDHKQGITICEQIEAVCRGGVRWVQLRMKGATPQELLQEGRLAKEICRRYNALFVINDNVEVARQLDADGVHLGKEDMNPLEAREILGVNKIIGATCNTWEDVLLRRSQQVDYVGLGPFRFTTTKKNLSPVLGTEGYSQIIARMRQNGFRLPVFAIGGITEEDIPPLLQTGIQGLALSGLIKNSGNIAAQSQKIIQIINNKP